MTVQRLSKSEIENQKSTNLDAQVSGLTEPVSCPGLFCPTIALDGILTRIRTPGGQVSIQQLTTLTRVMERSNCVQILITNRANLQLRSTQPLSELDLQELQQDSLAAKNPAIDHLRNIMASPMAGLDPIGLNVIPALQALEHYICNTPHLEKLSAKFSIGLEGGEQVSIRDRSNDLWLIAEPESYRLVLSLINGEEWWTPWVDSDAVALVQGVVDRYLQWVDQVQMEPVKHRRSRKPRLRDVIAFVGKEQFLDKFGNCQNDHHINGLVPSNIAVTKNRINNRFNPSIDRTNLNQSNPIAQYQNCLWYPQKDPDRLALEIICPLGKLEIDQVKGLAQVLSRFDLDAIRLTPWQTFVIPNVLRSQLPSFLLALEAISFYPYANHPARGIVACSGKSGCQAAATHAQDHAQQLIDKLAQRLDSGQILPSNDRPRFFPSIQISGCEKFCAQPKGSQINLIGYEINGQEYYKSLFLQSDQPINQAIKNSLNSDQATDQTIDLPIKQSTNQSINRPIDQSINQSVEQYIDQHYVDPCSVLLPDIAIDRVVEQVIQLNSG